MLDVSGSHEYPSSSIEPNVLGSTWGRETDRRRDRCATRGVGGVRWVSRVRQGSRTLWPGTMEIWGQED